MLAYGRRRRHRGFGRRRHMRGRGLMDILNKAHDFAKANQIVSKGAALLAPAVTKRFGANAGNILGKIGSVAGALGYGRRRHRRGYGRRRLHMGGALRLAGL